LSEKVTTRTGVCNLELDTSEAAPCHQHLIKRDKQASVRFAVKQTNIQLLICYRSLVAYTTEVAARSNTHEC